MGAKAQVSLSRVGATIDLGLGGRLIETRQRLYGRIELAPTTCVCQFVLGLLGLSMAGVKLIAALSALTLLGLASVAHADPLNDTQRLVDRNQWAPQTTKKSFEWDAAKSRWGLKLDVEQQPTLGSDYKNVQAGAFFKVTPQLRVGAGVTLTEQQQNLTNPALQTPPAPKVHLETAFKF